MTYQILSVMAHAPNTLIHRYYPDLNSADEALQLHIKRADVDVRERIIAIENLTAGTATVFGISATDLDGINTCHFNYSLWQSCQGGKLQDLGFRPELEPPTDPRHTFFKKNTGNGWSINIDPWFSVYISTETQSFKLQISAISELCKLIESFTSQQNNP